MIRHLLILAISCGSADADTIVAARTISANTLIEDTDLAFSNVETEGGETDPMLFIGMEARVALYSGRPIRVSDVGPPAIVERNQTIPLTFLGGGISIRTEGRSLVRGGPGDLIRVMNLESRTIVIATLGFDGVAYVHGGRN